MSAIHFLHVLMRNNPGAFVMLVGFAALFCAAWHADIKEQKR